MDTPNFEKGDGLITAVAQDADTDEVLMLAHMDREAYERTVDTGEAHYWSRSRKTLWKKGETSGNVQHVKEIRMDCDGDAILLKVTQEGGACHTGHRSCFHRVLSDEGFVETGARVFDPDEIYGE